MEPPTVECVNCKAQNPTGKNFCSDCGTPLGFASRAPFEPLLRRQIQEILKEQLKDQKTIELETSIAIASRVSEWAKLFGIYAGIPLAILVLTLAFLGIKSFTDLSASIETRRKDISNSLDDARNQAKHLHDEGDALNLEYQKQRENLAKVESLSKDLKVLDNKVDNLAKKVGVNVSGSGLAPGEANAILEALDRFQPYLQSLGVIAGREELRVVVEPGKTTQKGNAVAYYDEPVKTIHVAKPFASNPDETVSMYAETRMGNVRLLVSSLTLTWLYLHIQRGLAEYFWCSFTDNPQFGAPGNVYKFLESPDFTHVTPFIEERNTAIWVGAFWELRSSVGKATADKLLAGAWQRLKAAPRDTGSPSIVQELLNTDQALNRGSNISQINAVFERRKLDWSRLTAMSIH
jgi:hypothetical protein